MIVVGVDGSDEARRALVWAAAEARLRGVHLRILHAYAAAPFAAVPETASRARREAELILAAEAGSVEGLEVEASAVPGQAARVLLDASADADLLVVGSRGRHGFPGLLLGSVSHQLANHARCPVVIVPPDRSESGR